MLHTLVALVEDKPGVLNRVALVFRRRAFNIESLTVGRTDVAGVSRMTIVLDSDQVNVDRVICVAPHGRGGSFVFLAGGPDRIEVDESPGRVSEILQAAGVMYTQRELQE